MTPKKKLPWKSTALLGLEKNVICDSWVAVKSRSSLHIEKYDFNVLVLNTIFCLVVFSYINCPPAAKCTSENLLSK